MANGQGEITGAERGAGVVLIAGFVLTMVAMMHHPTSIHSPVLAGPVTVGNLVHLVMMTVVFANLWALAIIVRRQPTGPMFAMWIAYALATVVNLGAATVSGFSLPILAEHVDLSASPDLARALWALNQGFDRTGLFFTVIAFVCWAAGLAMQGRSTGYALAFIALLAGVVPACLLVTGVLSFDVHGAIVIYGAQAAWLALAGLMILKGRI